MLGCTFYEVSRADWTYASTLASSEVHVGTCSAICWARCASLSITPSSKLPNFFPHEIVRSWPVFLGGTLGERGMGEGSGVIVVGDYASFER
jgi:hypothetical protein